MNDVVALEAGEWGLEDYTVQILGSSASGAGASYGAGGGDDGFECLHFQQVGKLFRDDDEIL